MRYGLHGYGRQHDCGEVADIESIRVSWYGGRIDVESGCEADGSGVGAAAWSGQDCPGVGPGQSQAQADQPGTLVGAKVEAR